MPDWLESLLTFPVVGSGLRLLFLLLLFLLARQALRLAERHLENKIARGTDEEVRRGRLNTLLRVGYGLVLAALALLVIIMALSIVGIDIGPLVASAGVAGLAISLGAQSLIRDFIGGILILAEDQFRVGDVLEVNGLSGQVVRMTLRATYLRNVDGKLHTVPNGDIRILTNISREWGEAKVELTLPEGSSYEQVSRALDRAVARVQDNADLRRALLVAPTIESWDTSPAEGVQVSVSAKTLPGRQWDLAAALRRFATDALVEEGLQPLTDGTDRRAGEAAGS
jgi:small conductance mechanosensitive channel